MNTQAQIKRPSLHPDANQTCVGNNAARELAVPAALGRLTHTVNVLHERVMEMRQRLQPVLRIEPCDPSPKEQTPAPAGTIYDSIQRQAELVDRANNELNEIIRLLEC